jgi:hypothetical protein
LSSSYKIGNHHSSRTTPYNVTISTMSTVVQERVIAIVDQAPT